MNYLPEWFREKTDPIPNGRYLLGLSGGADSIALLYLLAEHACNSRMTFEAVHVNHGLRGTESDGDEQFVRQMCAELKIPIHVCHADLQGRHDENAAREARFGFFRQLMSETGSDAMILAHHADDLAETFLMRLIRGAGTEGLSCMKPSDKLYGMQILRPMLRITREEIRRALHESSIPWREDSTNADTKYLRNNIRRNIMPELERMIPGAANRIARASRIISEDNETLNGISEQFLNENAGERWIRWKELSDMPESMQCRILRMWWRKNTPRLDEHELNSFQTEKLVSLIRTDRGKINLPGGFQAVRGKQAIHITGFPRNGFPEIPFDGKHAELGNIRMNVSESKGDPGDGITEQEIPAMFLSGCTIRTRKPGDWIQPFGMKGKKKLQDYFVDRGIDEPWRDEIPLICRKDEVLLAAGIGTGGIPGWDGNCKNIRIQWSGEMPWKYHPEHIRGGSNDGKIS